MTTQEAYYQPLPAHWGDRLRDAYYDRTWPMPDKIAFAKLFVVGAIIVATAVAVAI